MITYSDSKQNSIEWITNTPEEWELKKLKYFFNYKKGSMGQKLTSSFLADNEGKFPVYSGQTENNGILGYWSEYEFDFQNEIIFCTTVGAKLMTNRLIDGKFSLSQNCLILIPKIKDIDIRYLNYFILFDFNYRKELLPCIIQPSLRMEDLDQYSLLIPPLKEQKLISQYLDKKTEKIDLLIEKIEKKIELLNQQKTALINQYVTKGLDPNVELKDSGIEWIGEIPKHWETIKLKYIIDNLSSGVSVNAEDSPVKVESEFGVLKTSCVYGNVFRFAENKKVFSEEYGRVKCPVKGNSIIISRMNTPDLVGSSGYVEKDHDNLFLPDRLWITEFKEVSSLCVKWISYIMRSSRFKKVLSNLSTGTSSSMKNITQDDLLSVKIPLCKFEEQVKISLYLDNCIKGISLNINLNKRRKVLLQEYRLSLISSVVTGKIRITEDMI